MMRLTHMTEVKNTHRHTCTQLDDISFAYLTPAEKLTTGKNSPSVLKFSNMPCTGWPLILKEMLGAFRSIQQLTTSSDVNMCCFIDATVRGIRPAEWAHKTHTCHSHTRVSQRKPVSKKHGTYPTTGAVHQSHTSTDHLQLHYPPSPLLHPGKGRNL